jgi:hypothetical protein
MTHRELTRTNFELRAFVIKEPFHCRCAALSVPCCGLPGRAKPVQERHSLLALLPGLSGLAQRRRPSARGAVILVSHASSHELASRPGNVT